MADKYLIHGATYCGDGTASNEAASAGAAGAWNDINVFHGTAPAYGTLAAGDRVFIRSKTSAGADLTITLTANLTIGATAATLASPVVWIVDGGNKWSGVDGVITYNFAATNWYVTLQQYNHLVCETQDSVLFKWTGAVSSAEMFSIKGGSSATGIGIDGTGATNYGRAVVGKVTGSYSYLPPRLIRPHFMLNRFYGYGTYPGAIAAGAYSRFEVEDPLIEINDMVALPAQALFYADQYRGQLIVNGGRLTGSFVTSGFKLANIYGGGDVWLNSFAYPKTINAPVPSSLYPFNAAGGLFASFNADTSVGSEFVNNAGECSSRADNNPPTLNAVLPDSVSSPWSWKVYPYRASLGIPLSLPLAKMFTDTAAAKTLTLEALVADTMALDDATAWLTITYVDDSTGLFKTITTMCAARSTPTALAASTAAWSAVTWGAINLSKKKIAVTTPTSIKKDTMIQVVLTIAKSSASQNDILFVCPDVQLS